MKKNFLINLIEKFNKKFYRKQTLKNTIIFLCVIIFLLLIDLLTKWVFFKYPNSTEVHGFIQYNLVLFGFRSQAHATTTFGDLLNINISNLLLIIVSWIMCIVVFFVAILSNKIFSLIVFSALFAGVMGNTIDRMYYQYVRNILFIPWLDKGTFNFADVIIVFSAFCCLIISFIMIVKSDKRKANK